MESCYVLLYLFKLRAVNDLCIHLKGGLLFIYLVKWQAYLFICLLM